MLINVPLKDQRNERTADGRPPEDGNMDCVPTALAAMVQALTGRFVSGDELHDAVYGQGYIGMQDPARFVALLASSAYGVRLIGPITGSGQALYGRGVSEMEAGHPVLWSIPSDWNDEPPTSPYAHMVAGCDVVGTGGQATVMNPYLDAYQTESAAWWQERFDRCAYKAMWFMNREGSGDMVPNGWHDDGTTLSAPNGEKTAGWIRQHVIEAVPQWPADLLPVAPIYGIAGGWQQDFAATRSVVALESGATSEKVGPDYRGELVAANAKIATLEAEIAKAGSGTGNGGAPVFKQAVDAMKAALAADADA